MDGLYSSAALPLPVRAEILRVLADVPGFVWRGEVTDRAGRRGVAVTADQDDNQALLVFDAQTGVLLAHERVALDGHWVNYYSLILEVGRTDRLG